MPGINIRRAVALSLYTGAKAIPKNLETKQILLNMINANTMGRTLAMNELVFSFPEANTYHNKNSKVKVKFVGVGYAGSNYFYYDRVLIERSFTTPDNAIPTISVATTIYTLLASLNSLNKSRLTTDDVVDGPVKAGAERLTLVAKSTSFLYIPGSSVVLGKIDGSDGV